MKFADTLGGDYNSSLQRRSPGDLVRLVLLHRLAGVPQAKKETGIPAQEGCPGFRGRISSGSGSELRHDLSLIHGHLLGDMEPRLKRTTMQNKRYLIEHRILPFFGNLPLNEITPAHVRQWQAQLLADKVAPTYAKTINNQLSAIFNYACKYYGLGINPARLAGSAGKKDAQEMSFWTVEQFNEFISHVKKLPARTGLSVLFWTGLRIGELLALCPEDIDLEARALTVRRNFQSVEGEEVITDPKTQRGRRVVTLPEKLCDEIRAYEDALYDPQPDDRLFPFTKHYFRRALLKGCAEAGMDPIRLHDLRHSHAALLIHLGTPILLVKERLGHEDIQTTLRTYGHLYPTTSDEAVKKMDDLMR